MEEDLTALKKKFLHIDEVSETESERKFLTNLLANGYKVEVVNPNSNILSEKYHVYQDLGIVGKKTVVVDNSGKIIGEQG